MTAARGPVPLAVSTSLDSCGVLESQIICKLDVSYNALPNATGYSATVTRADGSVVDYGGVAPGGTSLWVPYVGAGGYSVRITAYGEPERPEGDKPVISTEVSRAKAEVRGADAESETEVKAREATSQTQAGARGEAGEVGAATGEATAGVEATPTCTETPAPPEPIAPEPLPPEPPQDLDPANPDEDGDGIDDEQERLDYETAVAEQQAAEAVAEVPEAIDC